MRADDSPLGRKLHGKIDDAGRRRERIGLRRQADADRRTLGQAHAEHALDVDVEAFDAHVAGLLRIEAAGTAHVVKADAFISDARAEGVFCRGDGVLVGALRMRKPTHREGQRAGGATQDVLLPSQMNSHIPKPGILVASDARQKT